MQTYVEYENQVKENKARNETFLETFEKDLVAAGLKNKTINRHLTNVSFFLNTFLTQYDVIPMEDGPDHISMFLGDFFIRKCMWSTPETIRSTAASIKKFYKSMVDHGFLEKEQYEELVGCIKYNMDDWCCDCADFNDPTHVNPFMFMM